MEYSIVIIISLAILIIGMRKDYDRKISNLSTTISRMRGERYVLLRMVSELRGLLNQVSEVRADSPPNDENGWQRAWAMEFLRITSAPVNPDSLRAARREAIKREHPDAGGSAERMRMIEEAVRVLSR